MEVFLVPVAAARYELYCEVSDEPDVAVSEPPEGFVKRMVHRFRETLAEAERERHHGRKDNEPQSWMTRVKRRTLRWVAESMAEQRLLWHLRRQDAATFFYPDDIPESTAVSERIRQLRADFDKHRFWLILDSLGFLASGLLVLVPGPNILAYYFAFRIVGHFLSLRGARNGLADIHWRNESSPPLTELRRTLELGPDVRESRVRDIADRLRLEHLASFFKRMAESGAGS
jgi:K+-H+ exchange-related protein